MVVVVWETWLNSGNEAKGLGLTRQIWSDMQHFNGYISHQLFIDQDVPSHLLVVSQWRSREVADRIKEEYAESETVRQLKPLLAHERGRWVYLEDKPSE